MNVGIEAKCRCGHQTELVVKKPSRPTPSTTKYTCAGCGSYYLVLIEHTGPKDVRIRLGSYHRVTKA